MDWSGGGSGAALDQVSGRGGVLECDATELGVVSVREVSHMVRCTPDLWLLVSAAKRQAIVVECTEGEAVMVSMAELDVFGESLDNPVEWLEYFPWA
jgi:hypothetical protein